MLIKALERADRDQLEGLNHWLSATSFCPEEKNQCCDRIVHSDWHQGCLRKQDA